jgi:competence protein ComFC
MRCIVCTNLSIKLICNKCQNIFLQPQISIRKDTNIDIISFYNYSEIEDLIFTKYEDIGSSIYKILAKNSFKKFSQNFKLNEKIYSIAIDDNIKNKNFSHTAILNKSLQSTTIKPIYNNLIAQNKVSYAKQPLEFRQNNPRNFQYTGPSNCQIILCDDIVTTATTINEAIKTLNQYKVKVLFALVLCDARN